MDEFRSCGRKLPCPTLLMTTRNDPTVSPESSDEIYRKLRCPDKQYETFDFDRHIIINGDGCEKVFDRHATFLHGLNLGLVLPESEKTEDAPRPEEELVTTN